jgi:hypothetical protein
MKSIISAFQRDDLVQLGDKRVQIKKLTPALYKELFGSIDRLPGLVVSVMFAPKEQYYEYVLVACSEAVAEVEQVVSILSGLDVEYIHNNVGVTELIDYIVRTAKKNDFTSVIKNVKSLLPKVQKPEPAE